MDPDVERQVDRGANATEISGARYGRYVLLGTIGQGGMGVVYAAYDPSLDRRVALKVLRPGQGGNQNTTARGRLLREAKALARLSHPNVVHVYDAGVVGEGEVFLAMEFVAGVNLRVWRGERERGWAETLGLYVQAGAGLAAAHKVGLVHRDVKPDNILLGHDGRVLVLDFGLAVPEGETALPDERATSGPLVRAGEGEATPPAAHSDGATTSGLGRLTVGVAGTPWYMAPEQLANEPPDARTDQFSFCVTLYEALYGEHPYRGLPPSGGRDSGALSSLGATAAQTPHARSEAGGVRPAPEGSRVPNWLRQVLLRGLAQDPAARYPSMEALLGALRRDPRANRRRLLLLGLALALLPAAVALGYTRAARQRSLLCSGGQQKLAGVWDAGRRQALHKAFIATHLSYGQDTAHRVVRALDDYTARWVNMYGAACAATRLRGEQSEELLDLRMACLGQRLEAVKAEVKVFTEADKAVVQHAVAAVQALPSLDACADTVALRAPVLPPRDPKALRQLEELRRRLAEAASLAASGKYAPALPLLDEVVVAARKLAYRPFTAEALFQLGSLQETTGEFPAAAKALRQAAEQAEMGRDDRLVARSLAKLVIVVGNRLGHPDEGRRIADYAQAKLERIGKPDLLAAYILASSLGVIARTDKQFEEAQRQSRRALALARAIHPKGTLEGFAQGNLGILLLDQGLTTAGCESLRRAIEILQQTLGPDHPDLAIAVLNLGTGLQELGQDDEALSLYERALRLQAEMAVEHPVTALAHQAIGDLLRDRRQYDRALPHLQLALRMGEQTFGRDNPEVATLLLSLARLYLDQHQARLAWPLLERLEQLSKRRTLSPTEEAEVQFRLAQGLWQQGRERGRALALAAQARQGFAKAGAGSLKARAEVDRWLEHPAGR